MEQQYTKTAYEQLKQTIDEHMNHYYNEDAPTISDFEYDALMRELKKMEAEHPEWVRADSPDCRRFNRELIWI